MQCLILTSDCSRRKVACNASGHWFSAKYVNDLDWVSGSWLWSLYLEPLWTFGKWPVDESIFFLMSQNKILQFFTKFFSSLIWETEEETERQSESTGQWADSYLLNHGSFPKCPRWPGLDQIQSWKPQTLSNSLTWIAVTPLLELLSTVSKGLQ